MGRIGICFGWIGLAASPAMGKGILLRIGTDLTFGKVNAPACLDSLSYLYLPIPETGRFLPGLGTYYDQIQHPIYAVPDVLQGQRMHLDPDFENATYGDRTNKAKQLVANLGAKDFIVFYGAFRDVKSQTLFYALVGFLEIAEIIRTGEVPKDRRHENAHTRRRHVIEDFDHVVRGTEKSGRFERLIPIGDFRNGSYRVRKDLLETWGGVSSHDGFIQRSGGLIFFEEPNRFLEWLKQQAPSMRRDNFGAELEKSGS